MTQAAPEVRARRTAREALRDGISNSDVPPGRGENSDVAQEPMTARSQQVQATVQPTVQSDGGASAGTPAVDPQAFRAGTNPPGATRPVADHGARPEGTASQPSKNRGTGRDGV